MCGGCVNSATGLSSVSRLVFVALSVLGRLSGGRQISVENYFFLSVDFSSGVSAHKVVSGKSWRSLFYLTAIKFPTKK